MKSNAWLFRGIWAASLIILALVVSAVGCTTLAGWFGAFDSRALVIHTVDLFDQRRQPANPSLPKWQGDWLFRRERLAAVDGFLRREKPDVLVLQDLVHRRGSPSEDDMRILRAGALAGFDFRTVDISQMPKTQETRSLGVAVSLPVAFRTIDDPSIRTYWEFGKGGYLSINHVVADGQVVGIFNIIMDVAGDVSFLVEKVEDHLRYSGICRQRIVLAGYFPRPSGSVAMQQMFERLNLQDVAEEDCSLDPECYTISSENEIASLVFPTVTGSRVDKIFVSQDALVLSSRRGFDRAETGNAYLQRWGLEKNWPTLRFGWAAEVRFPRCVEGN